MPRLTIALGALLVVLGVGGYLATARSSPTALIPAAFGVVFVLLGWWATRPGWRKVAMHIAVLVGALGIAGTARGAMQLPALLSGETVDRPTAVVVQSVMAGLCLVYVILCIISFIKARRASS